MVALAAAALAAAGCSPTTEAEPEVLAFAHNDNESDNADYRDLVDGSARYRRNHAVGLPPTPDPTEVCGVSTSWTRAVATALDGLGHDPSRARSEDTGQGCRTSSTLGTEEVELRLDPLSSTAMAQVASARIDPPEGRPLGLLGFDELSFDATDDRIVSALHHPKLDLLEETRWIDVGDGQAVYVSLTVGPDGLERRDAVLAAVVGLEKAAVEAANDRATDVGQVDNDEQADVLAALLNVISSVAEGRPLDGAATEAGVEAIAFEYDFPENMAGLATDRSDIVCDRAEERSECRIEASGSTYRFAFTPGPNGDRWLLDDFHIDP